MPCALNACQQRLPGPQAVAFVQTLREFQDVQQTKPMLIQTLMDRKIDGRDYLSGLKAMTGDPVVLLNAA